MRNLQYCQFLKIRIFNPVNYRIYIPRNNGLKGDFRMKKEKKNRISAVTGKVTGTISETMSGFKKFIMRGNVVDMAVGVIIGGAFGKIVNSLVTDVIMPPIGKLTGGVDFSNLFINLSGTEYASLAEAQKAGAATINYGLFFNTVINFLIIAAAIFFMITWINKLKDIFMAEEKAAPADPTTKICPFCLSEIPLKAKKCAHCTSDLK